MAFLSKCTDFLWNPWLLGLFMLVGGWYTLATGFFQLRIFTWIRGTLGSLKKSGPKGAGLSQTQALSTALASTIGTGSIAGVATAITLGGPGAVFWMWVSAFLGMMTSFAEKALAVAYREGYEGGPMGYMEKGLPKLGKPLAVCFSAACLLASLAGGGMVQSNSIATSLEAAFGLPTVMSGLVTALLVGFVIFGGISRIGEISEKIVPFMAVFFLSGGIFVLFVHRAALPAALKSIFANAFHPASALGGYTAATAVRYGVARGVFTNEAGLGSSAMAHAAARTDSPAQEGMWGILEVFVATLLVCTVTALVILTAPPLPHPGLTGAPLSAYSFSTVLGPLGHPFVALCLLLFAFTSLLGWGYYGERSLVYLCKNDGIIPVFRFFYLVCVFIGAVSAVDATWLLADLFNALMALPNLLALLLLSPKVLPILRAEKAGPGVAFPRKIG